MFDWLKLITLSVKGSAMNSELSSRSSSCTVAIHSLSIGSTQISGPSVRGSSEAASEKNPFANETPETESEAKTVRNIFQRKLWCTEAQVKQVVQVAPVV